MKSILYFLSMTFLLSLPVTSINAQEKKKEPKKEVPKEEKPKENNTEIPDEKATSYPIIWYNRDSRSFNKPLPFFTPFFIKGDVVDYEEELIVTCQSGKENRFANCKEKVDSKWKRFGEEKTFTIKVDSLTDLKKKYKFRFQVKYNWNKIISKNGSLRKLLLSLKDYKICGFEKSTVTLCKIEEVPKEVLAKLEEVITGCEFFKDTEKKAFSVQELSALIKTKTINDLYLLLQELKAKTVSETASPNNCKQKLQVVIDLLKKAKKTAPDAYSAFAATEETKTLVINIEDKKYEISFKDIYSSISNTFTKPIIPDPKTKIPDPKTKIPDPKIKIPDPKTKIPEKEFYEFLKRYILTPEEFILENPSLGISKSIDIGEETPTLSLRAQFFSLYFRLNIGYAALFNRPTEMMPYVSFNVALTAVDKTEEFGFKFCDLKRWSIMFGAGITEYDRILSETGIKRKGMFYNRVGLLGFSYNPWPDFQISAGGAFYTEQDPLKSNSEHLKVGLFLSASIDLDLFRYIETNLRRFFNAN